MYGIVIKIAAFLRPSLSAKIPDGTAPIIAPIAKTEAIQVPSSVVMGILEFAAFNWSNTGDVHDRPVPAAAAPKQTIAKEEKISINDKLGLLVSGNWSFMFLFFFFYSLNINTNSRTAFFNLKKTPITNYSYIIKWPAVPMKA